MIIRRSPRRLPTVGTDHVGDDGNFVDRYKASRVKQPLLADPASTRPRRVGSLSLCNVQAFFNRNTATSERLEIVLGLPGILRLFSAKTISCRIGRGCCPRGAAIIG
jgi:hypothetical protein